MASSAQSAEAKELSLIGKPELRIALADSDEKLQNTLKTYLAPLLLKLASPHASVRNKIISVCSHINTRIKPDTIKLPVQALVEQFRAQNDVALIRHFDLSYIHKGVPRLSAVEKNELFPVILKGIATSSRTSAEHASQVMNLVFQLIEYFTFPSRGTEQDQQLRAKLEIGDDDAIYLASWFGKLILFTLVKKSQPGHKPTCPGLTQDEYSFLALQDKSDTWTPNAETGLNLTQTKARVARLLASGLFKDNERFLPALFASADPASAVSDAGEDMLKRVVPNTDFESPEIIKQLLVYFFGDTEQGGRMKVRSPLRVKILGLLSKSLTSTTFTHDIIKMVEEGLAATVAINGMDAMDIDGGPAFAGVQQISSHLANTTSKKSSGGLEVAKFRAALFSYINFVARHGKQESLHAIAPRVLTRLRDFIEEQGWPKAASISSQQELESRGYAYEVIGLLAKAGPETLIIEPNLDILRWLFRSQAHDRSSNNLTVSIDEALSTVLTAFSRKASSRDTASALESLLLNQMEESAEAAKDPESTRRSTRYTAIRFANRCLPFSSVRARVIDLMAIGAGMSDRPEVIEEGQRGLSPYWYRMLNGSLADSEVVELPTFADVMRFVFFDFALGGRKLDESDLAKLVSGFRTNHPSIFADALLFCRLILLNEALQSAEQVKIPFDSEWERKLNVAVESDDKTRAAVRHSLEEMCRTDQGDLIELLLRAFSSLLTSKETLPSTSSTVEATGVLPDLCALLPDDIVGKVAVDYQQLQPIILSNNHTLRRTAARVFGIFASHDAVRSDQGVQTTIKALVDKVSHFYSRHTLRASKPADGGSFGTYFTSLTSIPAEVNDADLKKAAFTAIGELCLYQVVSPASFGDTFALKQLIDRIYDVAKTGNEGAAIALGQISTILEESNLTADSFDPVSTAEDPKESSDLLPYISLRLHKLHEIRTAESHFSVGEAFSYLCAAWESTALSTALDIPSDPPSTPPREQSLPLILSRTLKDCTTTKPSLRKASVIWLLCLVQFCGHQPAVQQRLAHCQAAFKRCLVDRDELVQETASRGLGLVYEKGPANLREDLVRDLMSSFSADRKAGTSNPGLLAGQVGDDTQLFEPGALPTGSGESVSTYRDIMNLASEVGDSSLVYRFMSMAASDAVWSSRAAFGRFGLSSLLAEGGNGVEDYLKQNPKVYVSLYRYRFDPNEGVRRSMNGIWNALVKDTGKTVDAHFDAIVEDLLSHIFGREWRTRQACCTALADLVQGRALERYEAYLHRIWDACFKVLDDIKESVRAAAASLARTLTGILTRTLEADSSATKNATAMLGHVLPFLLSPSGLESSAEEVRLFAVSSLIDIVNKASAAALRPSIPELVERLLGLMGSLEHQAVEYVRLNAKRYAVSEQKIDDMRLAGVRSSPIMAAIERSLDLLDDDTMKALQPRLEAAMKSSIALPSKVACSRVLVSLATRRNFVFRPFADQTLKLLEKMVLDRNETVASSYATAAGYVARGASDKALLRLIAFIKGLYFDSAGDRDSAVPRRSVTAGDIVRALSKQANDRFNALAAEILPFVFVAKHDSNEVVKTLFQDTWEDNVGGARAVVLYLKEILELATPHLDDAQWIVKHTAARAVAGATTAIASLGGIDEAIGTQLWAPLEKALAAKTWEGKEVVLKAFVRFVQTGERFWGSRDEVKKAIVKCCRLCLSIALSWWFAPQTAGSRNLPETVARKSTPHIAVGFPRVPRLGRCGYPGTCGQLQQPPDPPAAKMTALVILGALLGIRGC
ncbi:ARM repeat-containing protein [Myriangium duriaei CBS 260.36]|uniref:ARM repeat-containing protein n=1 Tax=Myriangium duriaei CBS 260.36 TaxID=1168546 RepID=A0A9P4ML38_9PEZI|nr:ARM repeat-containing protein [Myriangium duriaei CBS 260.36]